MGGEFFWLACKQALFFYSLQAFALYPSISEQVCRVNFWAQDSESTSIVFLEYTLQIHPLIHSLLHHNVTPISFLLHRPYSQSHNSCHLYPNPPIPLSPPIQHWYLATPPSHTPLPPSRALNCLHIPLHIHPRRRDHLPHKLHHRPLPYHFPRPTLLPPHTNLVICCPLAPPPQPHQRRRHQRQNLHPRRPHPLIRNLDRKPRNLCLRSPIRYVEPSQRYSCGFGSRRRGRRRQRQHHVSCRRADLA